MPSPERHNDIAWLDQYPMIRRRFRDHVVWDESSCWLWTGALDKRGYGKLWFQSRNERAHRAMLILLGAKISGLTVDHLCHNESDCVAGDLCMHRRCVNPEHLEVVTAGENLRRMRARKA